MSDPFIGEIKAVAFNYAPIGWSTCNGQLLNITQNQALFAVLGKTYGGDGNTTFALPNLQGRAAMHCGQGTGLTNRTLGSAIGAESVALAINQIAVHSHTLTANNVTADSDSPGGNMLATSTKPGARGPAAMLSYGTGQPANAMAASAVANAGSGQGHINMQPYTVLNLCIALQGIFPTRG